MPELFNGYTVEQKTVTVSNTDLAMNAQIETEALDSWMVIQLVLSGSDMIMLFSRTIPTPAP